MNRGGRCGALSPFGRFGPLTTGLRFPFDLVARSWYKSGDGRRSISSAASSTSWAGDELQFELEQGRLETVAMVLGIGDASSTDDVFATVRGASGRVTVMVSGVLDSKEVGVTEAAAS